MSAYNKLWVALLILAANVVRSYYNVDLGMNDVLATAIVNGVGAYLVYLVPNKAA